MSKDKLEIQGPRFHVPEHPVPDFAEFFGEVHDGLSCLTNDDLESPEGSLRYQAALDRGTVTADDVEYEGFTARWFYVFRVESSNDDGEITGSHFRIVFMELDGVTFETHSDTAVNTLRSWIAAKGWNAWAPPVSFHLVKKIGRSQRTYHQLRIGPSAVNSARPAE